MTMPERILGQRIGKVLDEGRGSMSTSVQEQLTHARMAALARRSAGAAVFAPVHRGVLEVAGIKALFTKHMSFFNGLGLSAPLLLGIVLLAGVYQHEQQRHLEDIALLDSALLTDELPPAAYLDKGFSVYLQQIGNASGQHDGS
jgi:hypothetical protein